MTTKNLTDFTTEDMNELIAEMGQRDVVRREAIHRGIDREANHRTAPIPPLHIAAIERAVTSWLGWVDELKIEYGVGPVPEELVIALAESFADRIAGNPLMAKLEAALQMEYDVTNGHDIDDGILGRALDAAIQAMAPYARLANGSFLTEALKHATEGTDVAELIPTNG